MGRSHVKCSYHTHKKRDTRKLLDQMDMSVALIVTMVSQMFVWVQTHQIIKLNMYSILYISYTPKKAVKKKKKRKNDRKLEWFPFVKKCSLWVAVWPPNSHREESLPGAVVPLVAAAQPTLICWRQKDSVIDRSPVARSQGTEERDVCSFFPESLTGSV